MESLKSCLIGGGEEDTFTNGNFVFRQVYLAGRVWTAFFLLFFFFFFFNFPLFQLSSAQNNPVSKWQTLGQTILISYKNMRKVWPLFPGRKEETAWMCLLQRLEIKGLDSCP